MVAIILQWGFLINVVLLEIVLNVASVDIMIEIIPSLGHQYLLFRHLGKYFHQLEY